MHVKGMKRLLAFALAAATGCQPPKPVKAAGTVTDIAIGSAVKVSGVRRLGINLGGQNFYDSGQMLRNLVFRNPGFEGGTWQTILHCKLVTQASCTDENQYAVWPADFMKGARFEFLSGPAKGTSGTVASSTAAALGFGVTLNFAPLTASPAKGDFLIVRIDKPGNAEAGWWTPVSGGAKLSTEFTDLAPHTLGRQALRVEAAKMGQAADVLSYFDSVEKHSFVHLHGSYRITFRAKGLDGSRQVEVHLQRLDTTHGMRTFFSRTVTLTPGWKDYSFDFPADEATEAVGTLALGFHVSGASLLLDDVSLTPSAASADNPTAFRDEVVATLRDLHPGVLRYMDSGINFGSSLDNMLTPAFGRQRAGASTQEKLKEDVPMGLHEFLMLAQAVGAEPWYAMPAGTSPAEARALVEYLAGDAATPYGARRAALGQPAPWTSVFPVIHLELGNELWNGGSFYGATITDPAVHGRRAAEVFAGARSHPAYRAGSFDLILGGWVANAWWTGEQLSHSGGYDSTAMAPYLFANFNDASTPEAIFGPMFAQPEALDSRPQGLMALQREAVRKAARPAGLAVYEVNLGTMAGTASQAALDATVPSMGAGLAVIDHMLLMMRDDGVTTQAMFSLPEFGNGFSGSQGKETVPLWGVVVDMGGATNRRRPQFLAEQLANQAVLSNLLTTTVSGADPTWNQTKSLNDEVELKDAHLIQSFAFAEGDRRSVILLNLSRNQSLPVTLSGPNAPKGAVEQSVLTAKNITDNNETSEKVTIRKTALPHFDGSRPYLLAPFSMTVLTWRH